MTALPSWLTLLMLLAAIGCGLYVALVLADWWTEDAVCRALDSRSPARDAEWDRLVGAVDAARADVDAWLDYPSATPLYDALSVDALRVAMERLDEVAEGWGL